MLKRLFSSSQQGTASPSHTSGPAPAANGGNAFAQSQMQVPTAEGGGILDPWMAESTTGSESAQGDQDWTQDPGPDQQGPAPTGPAAAVTPEMTTDFNQNFAPVKHALGGTGDGGDLTPDELGRLFTPDQVGKLAQFLADGTVPSRMFNGVQNTSANTPQIRILLSSHILNTGTFDPATILAESGQEEAPAARSEGSPGPSEAEGEGPGAAEEGPSSEAEEEEDNRREVAANNCRHWAMMVYGYAGLPVPGEGVDGLWHTHDATGGINLGGTAPEQTEGGFHSAGSQWSNSEDGDWAPYFEGGRQAADLFQPGDWLQLAWGSRRGGHSVVLTRVVRENRRFYWIDYYSQNLNGLNSQRRLDENRRMSKRIGSGTTVFAHRPMSQATDPQTAGELFSGLHEEDRNGDLQSASPNEQYITEHGPEGVSADDGGPVSAWLCEELVRLNRARLDELGERLTPRQRTTMDGMNVVGNGDLRAVEQLVRVNQRIVHILDNDAHTRFNAGQEDRASDHYRIGRYGGRGNGNYGVWDRRDENGVVRAASERASDDELRRVSGERSSGQLRHMPDADQINWTSCPRGGAA